MGRTTFQHLVFCCGRHETIRENNGQMHSVQCRGNSFNFGLEGRSMLSFTEYLRTLLDLLKGKEVVFSKFLLTAQLFSVQVFVSSGFIRFKTQMQSYESGFCKLSLLDLNTHEKLSESSTHKPAET